MLRCKRGKISERAAAGKRSKVALHRAILHRPTCPHLFLFYGEKKPVLKDHFRLMRFSALHWTINWQSNNFTHCNCMIQFFQLNIPQFSGLISKFFVFWTNKISQSLQDLFCCVVSTYLALACFVTWEKRDCSHSLTVKVKFQQWKKKKEPTD